MEAQGPIVAARLDLKILLGGMLITVFDAVDIDLHLHLCRTNGRLHGWSISTVCWPLCRGVEVNKHQANAVEMADSNDSCQRPYLVTR